MYVYTVRNVIHAIYAIQFGNIDNEIKVEVEGATGGGTESRKEPDMTVDGGGGSRGKEPRRDTVNVTDVGSSRGQGRKKNTPHFSTGIHGR